LVPQQALGDLDEVVLPALPTQLLARDGELGDASSVSPSFEYSSASLMRVATLLRIEIDELPDGGERLLGVALAVEVRRPPASKCCMASLISPSCRYSSASLR
jgi:hypothetical protein